MYQKYEVRPYESKHPWQQGWYEIKACNVAGGVLKHTGFLMPDFAALERIADALNKAYQEGYAEGKDDGFDHGAAWAQENTHDD